jgi:hypothetical protein
VAYLPRGTYLAGQLNHKSYVEIRGDGMGATTLKLKGGGNVHLVRGSSALNCTVRDLTVDGSRTAQSGTRSWNCIHLIDCNFAQIIRVETKEAYRSGISLAGSIKSLIDHCYVHDTGYIGTWIGDDGSVDSAFTTIRHCVVINTGLDSIMLASDDVLCQGNYCKSSGNRSTDAGNIYTTPGKRRLRILGNHCEDSTGYGIDIAPDATYSHYGILVSGNVCLRNRNSGIQASVPGVSITGNFCWDNGQDNGNNPVVQPYGIYVDATDVVVSGNVCTDTQVTATQLYGININTGRDRVVVIGNSLEGNGTGPIAGSSGVDGCIFGNAATDGGSNRFSDSVGINISPTYGLHSLGGSSRVQALATPAAPTTAVGAGTPAGATDFYFVVAEDTNGFRTLTSAASTSAARGSSAANWRKVTWTAVPGAVKYYILVNTASTPAAATLMALTGTWSPGIITGLTITAAGSGGTNGTFTNGTLTGGGGSGATFGYTIAGGVVTSLVVLSSGSGYSSNPTFNLPSAGSLAGFVGTAKIAAYNAVSGGTNLEAHDSGQAINGAFTLSTRNTTADATIDGNAIVGAMSAIAVGTCGVTTTSVSSTTTAETKSLVGTITGTFTCPANFMVVGRKLRFRAHGVITTGGTAGTITFFLKFAGTTIASTGAVAPTISLSNMYWEVEVDIVCRSVGASGTLFVQGKFSKMNATTAATTSLVTWPIRGNSADPPAAVTVDTTASSLVDFQSTTSNNLHTITCNEASLEVLN